MINFPIEAQELYETRVLKYWDGNKIYTHTSAYTVQKEVGNPLNCTETDLPELGENETARWNGESWDVVADHRGTVVYSTETQAQVIWAQVGEIPPEYTETAPPEKYPQYYKWSGSAWIADTGKKQEVLAELTRRFNAITESLIVNSTITYSNDNGAISITCDAITQQNFTALYIMRDMQPLPYEVWEKDKSLLLASVEEIEAICQMIMANVETIRRQRKAIRDTFNNMTTAEIITALGEL
jgi:hypothetical protein